MSDQADPIVAAINRLSLCVLHLANAQILTLDGRYFESKDKLLDVNSQLATIVDAETCAKVTSSVNSEKK